MTELGIRNSCCICTPQLVQELFGQHQQFAKKSSYNIDKKSIFQNFHLHIIGYKPDFGEDNTSISFDGAPLRLGDCCKETRGDFTSL